MKTNYQDFEVYSNEKIIKSVSDKMEDNCSQFSSYMGHELRNPLTNIILSNSILLEKFADNEDARVYLDIISRSTRQMDKLIHVLLDSKPIHTNEVEEYSIHQLLDEVLDALKDSIDLKQVRVKRNYDLSDCKRKMNRKQMTMALMNIIINAVEAMSAENARLNILTKSLTDKFVIKIIDNGYGISEENLKYIFKPYYTNKPGGVGLGLSATHNILRSNNVEVTVESEEGKGTCFNLVFTTSS